MPASWRLPLAGDPGGGEPCAAARKIDDVSSTYAADVFRFAVLALQREGARRLNAALAPLGLTASQAEALRVLDRFGPLTVGEVGRHLVCESGSPSRLTSTLADRGLVARGESEADRRVLVLSLTDEGKRLADGVAEIEAEYLDAVSSRMPDAEALGALATMLAQAVDDPQLKHALSKRFPDIVASE